MKFDVNRVAGLARLHLTLREKKDLSPQLGSVLDFVKKITKEKIEKTPPTFQTTGLKDVFRKDEAVATRSLDRDGVLANAPDQKDGFFKVKPVQ